MSQVVGAFLEHGLLGVITLISLWCAFKKDREVPALHAAHAEETVVRNSEHASEMKALQERYITKSETWMTKYHEMTDGQNEVLTSLERRWGK